MNGLFFLDFTIGQTIFINLQNFIHIVLQVKDFDDFIELKFFLDVFYCRPDVIWVWKTHIYVIGINSSLLLHVEKRRTDTCLTAKTKFVFARLTFSVVLLD